MRTNLTLRFLCAVAVQAAMEKLLHQFRQQGGYEVYATYDVNPAVARRTMEGEIFDVGLTNPWFVPELIAAGRAVPSVEVPFGRVPLTIGAPGSEPTEIISSQDAVRDLLLNATSIGYIASGTSGKTFLRALENAQLLDPLRDRLRPMGPGEPPIAAAKGEIQYAVGPMSRILAAPGVVPIAIFPPELDLHIDMSLFVHRDSQHPAPMPLVEFLASSEHDDRLRAQGVFRYTP